MKSLIALTVLVLSSLAMASGLNKGEGYLMEVKHVHVGNGDEVSQQIKSYTSLKISSATANNYRLQAVTSTTWNSDAQFLDVKGVILQLDPTNKTGDATATVYEADGNQMGSVQTQVKLFCGDEPLMNCSAQLKNGNSLYLVINR